MTLRVLPLALSVLLSGTVSIVPAAERSVAAVRIELKPEAFVTGAQVTLRDLADVDVSGMGADANLPVFRLGSAPRVGYVDRVTREELDRLLRPRLATLGWRIEWSGARAVTIRSASRSLDPDGLVNMAKTHLLSEISRKFGHADVRLASPIPMLELPPGEIAFKPRPIDIAHLHPRMPVWVDIHVDKVFYRSVVVPFEIHVEQAVYVARYDLQEGKTVSRNDFELKVQDISAFADEAIMPGEFDEGGRIKQRLLAAQPLTRRHVSPQRMVLRGDPVKLLLVTDGVVIEARATAQQDADIGQSTKVKMENGLDSVTARVIAVGMVQADGR